jgi:hypothetical protein
MYPIKSMPTNEYEGEHNYESIKNWIDSKALSLRDHVEVPKTSEEE